MPEDPPSPPPSRRARVRRHSERGAYDAGTVAAILDEGLVAHVAFCDEDGSPVVVPMGYGRDGERLLLHGSAGSRIMRRLGEGVPLCLSVAMLDGLVLARSVFSHSMNYRSVVVFGRAVPVEAEDDKRAALAVLTERLAPGRWEEARQPDAGELAATAVLAVPLAEASAKVRSGPPKDLARDLELPVWAGVVPLAAVWGEPLPDALTPPGARPPAPRRGSDPGSPAAAAPARRSARAASARRRR